MSGSPKTTNMLPLPVFFSSSDMCRSGFIRAFRIVKRPSLAEFRRMGVEVEGAGDQHVEAGLDRLARGGDEVGAARRCRIPGR